MKLEKAEKIVEVLTSPFVEELNKVLVECYSKMLLKWREDCFINIEKKRDEDIEAIYKEAREIYRSNKGTVVPLNDIATVVNKTQKKLDEEAARKEEVIKKAVEKQIEKRKRQPWEV